MLEAAVRVRDEKHVDDNIRSLSNGKMKLDSLRADIEFGDLDRDRRTVLGKAANKGKWFKSIGDMQDVAADIVGPDLHHADPAFRRVVDDLFALLSEA